MALDVVLLSLVTAAAWGASAPLAKLGLESGGRPYQTAVTVVLVSAVIYWVSLVAFGPGSFSLGFPALAFFAFTGLLGTAIARVLSYNGVDRVGASVNSAAVNTRPVFASVGAVVFLGETLTVQTSVGIAIVVIGLVVLALSKGGDVRGWKPVDLLFPISAAIAFAAGNVVRRHGLTVTDVTPLQGVAINETAGLIGLVAFIAVRRRGEVRTYFTAPRRAYACFVGAGVLNAVALFALFEALDRGRVVIVDPISSPTSLFALLFTAILLREFERVTLRLLVGVVLVVTGIVLITAPQLPF